jgi:hypothetical protein
VGLPELMAPAEDDPVRLRREIAGLELELQKAKDELVTVRQASADAVQAVRALRKACEPFWTAFKMIYGEISRVEAAKFDVSGSPTDSHLDGKWEVWKKKLPGKAAEVIQALVEHGGMNIKQIMAAAHVGQDTAYAVTARLGKLGLLEKAGGKFSLKE